MPIRTGINRTIVELKFRKEVGFNDPLRGINRTIVELKYFKESSTDDAIYTHCCERARHMRELYILTNKKMNNIMKAVCMDGIVYIITDDKDKLEVDDNILNVVKSIKSKHEESSNIDESYFVSSKIWR